MAHRVFVYGTLKRGFPNHALLRDAVFVGTGQTRLAYPMIVQGGFFSPAMLPEPGAGHRVCGEVWEVGEAALAALDRLEATHLPTGYVRNKIEIELATAEITLAWVYFKPRERIAMVHGEPHADYQDRRYVPAHLRSR